jgi:hypothetical protein
MGIDRVSIKLLMREAIGSAFKGRLLTIGRQDIWATRHELAQWAREMRFDLNKTASLDLSQKGAFRDKGFISDLSLFRSLGFDSVESMDISDYEGCTVVHDLNTDAPSSLYGRYDTIIDGGSSEHIFNLPIAFKNYCRMLKVGGRMIHISPMVNWVNHGFYMFSPNFFLDYYGANRWTIRNLFVRELSGSFGKCLVRVYEIDHSKAYRIRSCYTAPWLIQFAAVKTSESTWDASVQQSRTVWKSTENSDLKDPASPSFLSATVKRHLPVPLKEAILKVVEYLPVNIGFLFEHCTFLGRF